MSPRLGALAAVLVAPALPMLVSTPAHAVIGTICVGPVPAGTPCNTAAPTIQSAIAASTAGDTIRVGPGEYKDGPYQLPPGVSLRGTGAGTNPLSSTVLSVAALGSQTLVTVRNGSTLSQVRVEMATGSAATGINVNGGTVNNVVAFGAGSTNSNGIVAQSAQLVNSTVNMDDVATGTGVRSLGNNLVISQTTWNGGGSGYVLVAPADATPDTVRQITVNGEGDAIDAVTVKRGRLNIDNAVLDLGAQGSTGLLAEPDPGQGATIQAVNLTIVGGGGGSRGVFAHAAGAGASATVNVINSIIRGPATSLERDVSGGGTATVAVNNTIYQNKGNGIPNGSGNLVNADPLFRDPAKADYRIRAGSPAVDVGSLVLQQYDRDGEPTARSVDGNGDGVNVPDMGAYELQKLPRTTITAGPSGLTRVRQPVFQFKNDVAKTFECRLDGGSWNANCPSGITTPLLADGPHTFEVRGTDPFLAAENPPAVRTFTVDGTAPIATITKKPAKRFYKKRVKFKFATNDPTATLQCQLDGKGWKACNFKWKFNTKVGKHKLEVRAVDPAGNTGPVAKYGYKRLAPKRR